MSARAQLLDRVDRQEHLVQFYGDDDAALADGVRQYLARGVRQGHAVLVIATPEHNQAFLSGLEALVPGSSIATRNGQSTFLDAQVVLDRLYVGGELSWDRFDRFVGTIARTLLERAPSGRLTAYGEMVGLLWAAGRFAAAARLEEYWNRLLQQHQCSLLCAYPIDVLAHDCGGNHVEDVLASHTHLLPSPGHLAPAVDRALADVLGPRLPGLRLLMAAHHRPMAEMPDAEAAILWVRANLPSHATAILQRARHYHAGKAVPTAAYGT